MDWPHCENQQVALRAKRSNGAIKVKEKEEDPGTPGE